MSKTKSQPAWKVRLAEIRALEDGWDGYGSPAPTRTALRTAARILERSAEEAGLRADEFGCSGEIDPTPDGGISLHVRTSTFEVEVEIFRDGEVSFWVEPQRRGKNSQPFVLHLPPLRVCR